MKSVASKHATRVEVFKIPSVAKDRDRVKHQSRSLPPGTERDVTRVSRRGSRVAHMRGQFGAATLRPPARRLQLWHATPRRSCACAACRLDSPRGGREPVDQLAPEQVPCPRRHQARRSGANGYWPRGRVGPRGVRICAVSHQGQQHVQAKRWQVLKSTAATAPRHTVVRFFSEVWCEQGHEDTVQEPGGTNPWDGKLILEL